jgi:acetyl esterase/lipase
VSADGVPGDLMWPARVHYSPGRRVILFVHGGGIYGGSLRTHRNVAAALAKSATADVLLIDYRRMPEYLYPAQIDDVLRAYRWLLSSGYRNENIAIVGESVGSNFAMEAMLRQMQVNGRLPAAVVAMSPVVDLEMKPLVSAGAADADAAMQKQQLGFDPAVYLKGKPVTDPMASPVYADLTGFPALLLQVGSRDALRDDVLRFGQTAEKAGVQVNVETWPGMIHQWQIFPFWVQDARRAIDSAAAFIDSHFEEQ